jgi:nitrite reductase/ring-hydroxylating ferredoxin subunit
MGRICLGSVSDIADGQAKGFDPFNTGKDTLFVVRKGQQIVAYTDICPHYGTTSLPWKRHQYLDASNEFIVCAAHGALFDVNSGLCVRGACKGQSLHKVNTEILPGGELWVEHKKIEESDK